MRRVLIVADHTLVGHAVRQALRQTVGFRADAFASGRQSITRVLADVQPDVVLVDEMGHRQDTLDRLAEAAAAAPGAKALVLAASMDDAWLDEAFAAGADAVISRSVQPVALATLMREVVQGTVVHRPRRAQASAPSSECPLTARELEILRLAAEGHTNSRIARELWVTEQTVKFHLSNTYRKLGVANRTEASRYAHMNRLVAPREQLAS
jgi:DNA-binding NarL/FixJ family response regulator